MRILMRAQLQHDKAFSPHDVLLNNLMGGNSGNWLYQYSLFRALMLDESTVIDIFNPTKETVNEEFIDKVNSQYDVFVLPLANAFKLSFIDEMKSLTALLNGLKIPCVVPGVGIQAKTGVNFSDSYEYTKESKEFIKAILNKSSLIGVRGESTGEFFKSLGFKEERDFTVIGCPSLYTYGMHLPAVKPLDYSPESKLLITSKIEHETKAVTELMKSLVAQHPNYVFIPQRLQEMLTCYYGNDYRIKSTDELKKRFYDRDKAIIPSNPYSWYEFCRNNVDFSIGTRLHGNVAAILGGVPCFIMATDQRVSELAEYHNIAYSTVKSLKNKIKITDIIEKYDFTRIHQGHPERFNHFVDFLEKNGLETVYTKDRNIEKVYFDFLVSSLDFSDDYLAFGAVSDQEKLQRVQRAAAFYADKAILTREKLMTEREQYKARRTKWPFSLFI